MTRSPVVPATGLGLTGRLLGDGAFEVDAFSGVGVLTADGRALGDTPTLLFVEADPGLDVGVGAHSLAAVARGDTVFVYMPGTVDPSVFTRTCSSRRRALQLDITAVAAPPGVRAVATGSQTFDALGSKTARALR